MDESETQHISVLGLSDSSEGNALQKLLGTMNNSFQSATLGITEHRTRTATVDRNSASTSEKVHQSSRLVSSSQSARKTPEKRRSVATSTKEMESHSYESLQPHISSKSPSQVEYTASFQADDFSNEADLLPPPSELVHKKIIRPLTETLGVTTLTRIQKLSWTPMIDKTRDVLIRSETGSGKTLAYALPLIHSLLCDCDTHPVRREIGTLIIILCPTRELVEQVSEVLSILTRCALFLTVGGIHGGENRHKEKARLRKGLPILVASPGRLLDHMGATTSFRMDSVQTIVLDEADRLLDMGFERTIRAIMEILENKVEKRDPVSSSSLSKTQNEIRRLKRVLVSATITAGVEKLSHFALRQNITRVGETQDTFSIPSSLRQHYVVVPAKHRLSTLISFLRSQMDAGAERIIVFVSTADSAEFHYCLLSRLQSPYSAKRGKDSRAPMTHRYHKPHQSTKKQIAEANSHIYEYDKEVVTFDDESDTKSDDGAYTLSERNSILDVNIFKLHGNMTQVDRASVFHAFKHGTRESRKSGKGILFCTDVAARGLDMPRIDWIVHYDPPTDPTCYVHRIGRTARIGNVGYSVLFLMPHESDYRMYLSNFIANENKKSVAEINSSSCIMEEKKYESFLFYLTKLDPNSNHMWMQSTATLEWAISRLVMKKKMDSSGFTEKDSRDDYLTRLALFAYQSYIRAYAGFSRELKRLFFNSNDLHLGHIAQSFGIDKKPNEVRLQLRGIIREDHKLAKETSSHVVEEKGGKPRKKLRVEIDHEDRYRSMIVQKQRKVTRDWYDKKKDEEPRHSTMRFSEFDA